MEAVAQGVLFLSTVTTAQPKAAVPIPFKPICWFGDALWGKRCSRELPCPCGYDCNLYTNVCCPSDPEDVCDDGEMRKGKCGPKNYPCPCGYECRNHMAKGYVVCCPKLRCPKPNPPNTNAPLGVCKTGYPITNWYCGKGGKRCPTGYVCNIHPADAYSVCCPDPNMCATGQAIPAWFCGRGGSRCPSGYTCNTHPTDLYAVCCPDPCPADQCKIGKRLVDWNCGFRLARPCPKWYQCQADEKIPDLNFCCPIVTCPIGQVLPGVNCQNRGESCPDGYSCVRNRDGGHCCPATTMFATVTRRIFITKPPVQPAAILPSEAKKAKEGKKNKKQSKNKEPSKNENTNKKKAGGQSKNKKAKKGG